MISVPNQLTKFSCCDLLMHAGSATRCHASCPYANCTCAAGCFIYLQFPFDFCPQLTYQSVHSVFTGACRKCNKVPCQLPLCLLHMCSKRNRNECIFNVYMHLNNLHFSHAVTSMTHAGSARTCHANCPYAYCTCAAGLL